jgi:NAD(P)-dependent dehydrogenase (short-subunit alcohol dehydrogenase family)
MGTATTKAALVTGAARGIGLATAKRFLADGWRVALLDIDEDTLDRTQAALSGSGAFIAICCDVADPAKVAAAFATIAQQFGRLDALVNNAGIAIFKPISMSLMRIGRACLRSTSPDRSCARRPRRR